MSQAVLNALEKVQHTEWGLDRGVLEIRNAVLFFTNFAGKANKYGNTSKTFNVVLPNDLKEYLEECQLRGQDLHVNIHRFPTLTKDNADDPCVYYINVKINMETEYAPLVTLYTQKQTRNPDGSLAVKKSRISLEDATIGVLDRTDMDRADVKINIRDSKANPGNAVFYLRQLNVIQTLIPDFGGIYEDWDGEEIIPEEDIEDDK